MLRAILLASAKAATIGDLRSNMRSSQGVCGAPRRRAQWITAIAPVTSNRRMSRCPIFLRCFPQPLLSTRRMLPRHQAEPSGEIAATPELVHRQREGFDRERGDRADAKHRLQLARHFRFV
tara:strand:- start:78 stop:440 length:363 start_codon:yes stop_codon:yes gene_type:complete